MLEHANRRASRQVAAAKFQPQTAPRKGEPGRDVVRSRDQEAPLGRPIIEPARRFCRFRLPDEDPRQPAGSSLGHGLIACPRSTSSSSSSLSLLLVSVLVSDENKGSRDWAEMRSIVFSPFSPADWLMSSGWTTASERTDDKDEESSFSRLQFQARQPANLAPSSRAAS